MSVQSKIASLLLKDNRSPDFFTGSNDALSVSPFPARMSDRVLFEDDSTLHYHAASGSGHNHNSRFSGSASISVHGTGSRSPSRPLLDQQPHSHISISSDDPITDATEILVLRNKNKILQSENMDLRLKVQRLHGCLEAISYVLIYSAFLHTTYRFSETHTLRSSTVSTEMSARPGRT